MIDVTYPRYVLCVSLLSFCLAKNESSKEKGEFWQTAPHAKTGLTLVSQFAYRRHALKLLPLLGTIMLLYAWQPVTAIVRSPLVSPATIKARSWAGQQRTYQIVLVIPEC